MERRDFIKLLGIAGVNTAAYAACSAYMQEALAGSTIVEDMLTAPVHCEKGSLKDIEHVVILMQENRSFDHYFGALRGVRGFGDPRPLKMRDGEPVWHQAQNDAAAQRIRPYRLPKGTTTDDEGGAGGVFLQDPKHDYSDGLAAWNNGLMDKWIPNKDIVSMAHYVEKDIPLYFKLAKAFTVCDANFCSHNGATDVNRSYFWTGTSNGQDNNFFFSFGGGKPDWKTYPEKLEDLGVDWKFYQDGLKWTRNDPFSGNYGDNTLEHFVQYKDKTTSLYKKNQTVNSVLRTDAKQPSQLELDVVAGKLPAVSWIVSPEAFSEHPKYPPHFGEYYLHEILRALIANKDIWKKTALFISYDENGGFFDHVPPPAPPMNNLEGAVSPGIGVTVTTVKEVKVNGALVIDKETKKPKVEEDGRDANSENAMKRNKDTSSTPLGMGMRVPLLVISPWSAGGRVCSEVFDHTSFIRFLDTWLTAKGKQTGKDVFPNISSWRKAIAGDLTSTFDFKRETGGEIDSFVNLAAPVRVFSKVERDNAQKSTMFRPALADVNADPDAKNPVASKQDRTRCGLLPVAYDFQVCASASTLPGKLRLTFENRGKLGVAFTVYDYQSVDKPRRYSVEGVFGVMPVQVFDTWDIASEKYHLVAHGPNGYLGEFRGETGPTEAALAEIADISLALDRKNARFVFGPWPTANGKLKAINAYTGEEVTINNGTRSFTLSTQDGWYDLSFVDAVNDNTYLRRYAGHMENGKLSKTDPAIGLIYDEKKRVYVAPGMSV